MQVLAECRQKCRRGLAHSAIRLFPVQETPGRRTVTSFRRIGGGGWVLIFQCRIREYEHPVA